MLIELIADTLDDAITIQKAKADRIELISALSEGGLTPGIGLISLVTTQVHIPVNVMVRPHCRSFVYSGNDIAVMNYEIESIMSTKANGLVMGMLDAKNHIHTGQLEYLLSGVKGRSVTFHRAIDDTTDPVEAVRILSRYPEIKTVLTSGGKGTFLKRMDTIVRMKEAAPQLELLVGSGITLENIAQIHRSTATGAYHFGSAIRKDSSPFLGIDEARVTELISYLRNLTPR